MLISSAVFTQLTVERPYIYLTNGRPFLSKLSLPVGDLNPQSNTWFLDATRVVNPNGITIGSAVFAWLITVSETSSSAAAERPREPLSQLKSCQLLHSYTKNHI